MAVPRRRRYRRSSRHRRHRRHRRSSRLLPIIAVVLLGVAALLVATNQNLRGMVSDWIGNQTETPIAVAIVPTSTQPPSTPIAGEIPPMATQTPVPTPPPATPTPVPVTPTYSLTDLRQAMLASINVERERRGLHPLVLGNNGAAQAHADSALANCSPSHWGVDGLKPYMRYSLAGGYQVNGENAYGVAYCTVASDGLAPLRDMRQYVREATDTFLSSPGHLQNLLASEHRKVNLGIAWDRFNVVIYQHFEGNYVTYEKMPSIDDGILSMSGTVRNGPILKGAGDLSVQVYYDPLPHPLTKGQLARTYCYDNGTEVASLRRPNPNWVDHEYEHLAGLYSCPDPYDVPAASRVPHSFNDAMQVAREYRDSLVPVTPRTVILPWITADRWDVGNQDFAVVADLRDLIGQHGPGVYSLRVAVWPSGSHVSHYSVFVDDVAVAGALSDKTE